VAGAGVLSLTDGVETDAISESFGYDGDHVYFQLVHGSDSDKMDFVATTEIATLTAFTEQPARSVIVRGELGPVPDEDDPVAMRAIAANATIPTVHISLDTDPDALSFDFYRLCPAERSGRKFGVVATTPGSP
jgi:nitroimidazol reductase NimA-like FMN-containing flavoprotein (pyridoxamine 5'-phosphate oxidase superfamily)